MNRRISIYEHIDISLEMVPTTARSTGALVKVFAPSVFLLLLGHDD